MAASPEFLMVSGYTVCGGQYISADMEIKPGAGVDPSRLFDDLIPLMAPSSGRDEGAAGHCSVNL